jgi:hypothetical protein
VFTCTPKVGYVGVGVTTGPPKPFREAEVVFNGSPMRLRELELEGTYEHDFNAKGEEYEE